MRNPLVIYHADCVDGFTAAWCAWREFGPDAEYRPWAYDDRNPSMNEVRDRDVYVLDFSFEPDVVEDMAEHANRLVLLDHHQTAFERFAEDEFDEPFVAKPDGDRFDCTVVLDPNHSGARMAWRWFANGGEYNFGADSPPKLVRYVEDRDLWNWDLPDSREINAGVRSYDLTFEKLAQWAHGEDESAWSKSTSSAAWNNHAEPKLRKEGRAILRAQQNTVDRVLEHATPITLDGYDALAVNSPIHQSEIGNALAEQTPNSIGAVWYVREDEKVQVSLRAKDDGPDVSKIAEKFGGGGHSNAAGFSRDIVPEWLPGVSFRY